MFCFRLLLLLYSITILLSFSFVDTYIPMDTYTNKSCMIGPVRISTMVHPSSRTSSLFHLLRCTPEYLHEHRYSEIWDNTIVRGYNTEVEAKSLPSTLVLWISPYIVPSLNSEQGWAYGVLNTDQRVKVRMGNKK